MSSSPEDANNNKRKVIKDKEHQSHQNSQTAGDNLLAGIQKKITDAFDIFDHESNKTVDVREVGTIIRSLMCCPSEAELHDMLAEVEEEESTGYIRFEKFLPMMTKALVERRYKAATEDELVKAFQVLDIDGKGFLTADELTKYMTEEGECLRRDELKQMLRIGMDEENDKFQYKKYAHFICYDANVKIIKRTWSSGYIPQKKIEGEDEDSEDKKGKSKKKKGKKGKKGKGKKGKKGGKGGKGGKKGKKGSKKGKKGKKKASKSDIIDDDDDDNEQMLEPIDEVSENIQGQDLQDEDAEAGGGAEKQEKKKKKGKKKGKKKK